MKLIVSPECVMGFFMTVKGSYDWNKRLFGILEVDLLRGFLKRKKKNPTN